MLRLSSDEIAHLEACGFRLMIVLIQLDLKMLAQSLDGDCSDKAS